MNNFKFIGFIVAIAIVAAIILPISAAPSTHYENTLGLTKNQKVFVKDNGFNYSIQILSRPEAATATVDEVTDTLIYLTGINRVRYVIPITSIKSVEDLSRIGE